MSDKLPAIKPKQLIRARSIMRGTGINRDELRRLR